MPYQKNTVMFSFVINTQDKEKLLFQQFHCLYDLFNAAGRNQPFDNWY